jgi:hypothetical protein
MGEKMTVNKLLVEKPERKRPLGKPSLMWRDNVQTDLAMTGWVCVDWTGQVQDRCSSRALVNAVMSLRVPLNAGKLPSG